MMYTITKKRGFTLIETLFYISGLVLLLVVITTIFINMYDWYRVVTVAPRADLTGIAVADKLIKDIRTSSVINIGQSSFDTTNGSLSVTGQNDSISTTREFFISNNRLGYKENGGATTYLTSSDMTIAKLYFTNLTSPISSGIKFDMDITFKTKQGSTTKTYSNFAILRQSYE